MIKIIGTTHFDSKEAIEGIIKEFNPDVIGVELCEVRFKAITGQLKQESNNNDSLINQITNSIKQKAEEEGLDYGSDMKTAMYYAINNNMPLLLLDKNIIEIQLELMKLPIEEQQILQQELVKFQKEGIQKEVDEEEVIRNYRENLPNMYKTLIEDRNEYIANKIIEARNKYKDKDILIFLGKGHVKDIERRLLKYG